MSSFDQSLKTLLHQAPADFIRFALRDPAVRVLSPLPSVLPARGRDVDGGYLAEWGGAEIVAHVEFHRRHQSLEDLALDVGEAQIRFYRRERKHVLSVVWDLYGREDEPVTEARTLDHGVGVTVGAVGRRGAKKPRASRAVYVRVNLRGEGWRRFLAEAPPALWPLVALCRGGACEEAVHEARDAIRGRTGLTAVQRADHLAVLWFVAEKEDVPVQVMRAYISEQELMASTLYKTILQKGKAEGRVEGKAEGEAKANAETIVRLLTRWLGEVDAAIQERIRHVTDPATLQPWLDEACFLDDPKAARRLAKKIQKALPA
jgi:predicted transposase YdaD